jgi:hypothetical protein
LDNRIRNVPRSVHYLEQSFQLKKLKDFYVGSGNRTTELYSVSIGWFLYRFIYEKFVVCRVSFDLCPSSQHILVRVIPSGFRFEKMCLCR